jgi:hypothetical protein
MNHWTNILPEDYASDYRTPYVVRHLPDPKAESDYLRPGTIFRELAYGLGKFNRWNGEGCKYEWCLLSDYWAAGQPPQVAIDQSNVLLQSSLKACQDQIARLDGKIAAAKEALA